MDITTTLVSLVSALAGLALAGYFFNVVKQADPGNELMVELMEAIQQGARAFLRREYTAVAGFVVVLAALIFFLLPYGPWGALAYVSGAFLSALAGFVGMTIATLANARTTEAARSGPQVALPIAFRGGAVMGFTVAGLSLLGLSIAYILFVEILKVDDAIQVVTAFGLGASSIALFSRVGGGIYTKAADVGADLVGKVEAGIPEDDPRNPATIADNVGDNVGDVAGMGADLFESYAGSLIAPIALAAFAFSDLSADFQTRALAFPFAVGALGMIASIVGAFQVRTTASATGKQLSKALHRGTDVAAVITVVGVFILSFVFFGSVDGAENFWGFPLAVTAGLLVGTAIGKVSEIYTSEEYKPVKAIAASTETGPATTILSGISAGMISVAWSVILVLVAVGVGYLAGNTVVANDTNSGIYGIALAAIGMLATTGVVVAVDAYGPIADNAGGIAEMAHLPPEVRAVTDSLDSLGNTTAAVAKGFAVGSAAVTSIALFKAFEQAILVAGGEISLDIGQVEVFAGLFLGAMLPFLFAALTIRAVGNAANQMIEEVRRQFREIPGLREGREGVKADHAKCVDISTTAALKEMIVPGGLAIVVPLLLGFTLGPSALGGFLGGALVSGFCLAIFMSNAGGAWDNAKKYIEAGAHGGKGSEQHKAAVVGDTVGDPFKDTSGPAMNILIKVMTIVSLIFASAFVG